MKKTLILSSLLFTLTIPLFATVQDDEKNALMRIYNATNGPNWESRLHWGEGLSL